MSEQDEGGNASRKGGSMRTARGIGDRHIAFTNIKGREAELAALMARFRVQCYQKFIGREPQPEFWFLGDRTDFFLAQLRQAGFEFEEREGWD